MRYAIVVSTPMGGSMGGGPLTWDELMERVEKANPHCRIFIRYWQGPVLVPFSSVLAVTDRLASAWMDGGWRLKSGEFAPL